MHRSHIRQNMEQDRMTGLVVGGDLLFFLRDDTALLLRADADLDKRTVNIRLANIAAVLLGRAELRPRSSGFPDLRR